ncbi:hypothetical protein DFH06DRAFT_1340022 [Mycena polygramma]|nr:hypothetical protein DFH06DRAFT_1340022 [Mycena polygramma]
MNYSIHTVDPTTTQKEWVLEQIFGLCAEMLLYGVLLVLLGTAVHLLYPWTGAGRT